MTEYKYESLLERAQAKLPKKTLEDVRFKIPEITSFVEGNQTIIQNIREVASKLNRDPKHLMKYLSKELATAGNLEPTRAVFQGKFSSHLLNDRIKAYVNEFIICHECHKPDTLIVKQERMYYLLCEACGARAPVRSF
ncbi:MAG: translation initiation factor IF-2 subunit beta [Euryarchaeota archaeon]|nr:translation initiation factor IF-2 subunit beta [Euryarchaeota archaeon]